MGADIHGFLEYSTWTASDGEDYWECLMANFGSRDYTMFGILAGVRDTDMRQVVPLRGIPEGRHSYEFEGQYYTRISDDMAAKEYEGYVSLETAQSWGEEITYNEKGEPKWTVSPDWHSASWLTREEVAQVLAEYMFHGSEHGPYNVQWDALLAAMTALEERGAKVRFVFYFDN